MKTLSDGMILYHGSYAKISEIDLKFCKAGKDFGKGFYMTDSYEQARSFVRLSVKREKNSGNIDELYKGGYVNIFKLRDNSDLKIFAYDEADINWLHFIASNRNHSLFNDVKAIMNRYDIIIGKIANDRTAQTLQLYLSGAYGSPGTEIADKIAITTLLPNRLDYQICFKTQKSIDLLEYLGSDKHDII